MSEAKLQIVVLGGGCQNCHNLEANARTAAAQLGVAAEIGRSGDRADYARYGLLYTPGLVINGRLMSAGRVPDVAEVVSLLAAALN